MFTPDPTTSGRVGSLLGRPVYSTLGALKTSISVGDDTAVAGDFAKIYLDFLKDMKTSGQKVDNIALVHENTEYGTSVANVITGLFRIGPRLVVDVVRPPAPPHDPQAEAA